MRPDYETGRNDGWQQTLDNQADGPQTGYSNQIPADPGSGQYLQGFQDGVELYNSGFDPAGQRL